MATYFIHPEEGIGEGWFTTSVALAALMSSKQYTALELNEDSGEFTMPADVPAEDYVIVAVLGQSEQVYASESTGIYRQLTAPAPTRDGSFTLIQRNGSNETVAASSTITRLTAANKWSVNSAIPVIANAIEFACVAEGLIGKNFVVVELSEEGTGRTEIVDDSRSGRQWPFTREMINDCVAAFGRKPDAVCEFWWANDFAREAFWTEFVAPLYWRQRANGTPFILGNVNPDMAGRTDPLPAVVYDHCFWDHNTADPSDEGQGLFPRTTKFHVQYHSPWGGEEIARPMGVRKFLNDPRFTANGKMLPQCSKWATGDGSHPDRTKWSGQGEAGLMMYMPVLMDAAGIPVTPPKYGPLVMGPGNAYAELDLAEGNGGVLSTKAAVHGMTPLANWITDDPAFQEVMGFSIIRAGDRFSQMFYISRPGINGANASIDSKYHGTVATVDDKHRFTMVETLGPGDIIVPQRNSSYFRSDYTRHSYPNSESQVRHWTPIEHVAKWFDPDATYGMAGFEITQWFEPARMVGEVVPTDYWTTVGNGPVFRRTNAVPSGSTKIRHRVVMRVPSDAGWEQKTITLFDQEANGFDVRYQSLDDSLSLFRIEDGSSPVLAVTPSGTNLGKIHRDLWHTLEFYADFEEGPTGTFACRFNGELQDTEWTKFPFTQKGSGTFQGGRPIRLHGVPTSLSQCFQPGVHFASHKVWVTTGGVETLWMEVEGDAETVNASQYRDPASGDAI